MKTILRALAIAICLPATALAQTSGISTDNVSLTASDGYLNVSADILLDGLHLKSDRQVFVTPVVKGGDDRAVALPSVLVSGRDMHYAYERGSLKDFDAISRHDILKEVRRLNGKPQRVDYITRIPLEKWMRLGNARVAFVYDSCGCGVDAGSMIAEEVPINLNPAARCAQP